MVCGSCDAEVGIVDDRAEGWRIWKWSVAISFPRKVETFSIQKWISAHFLALIENQGVRKFSVRSDSEEESSLLVGLPLLNGFTVVVLIAAVISSGFSRQISVSLAPLLAPAEKILHAPRKCSGSRLLLPGIL